MKAIFKTTGAEKDRTLVRGKSNAIGLDLTSASFPALVEQPLDGKTVLIVVKDSAVVGVFNRLGQEYPLKAKQSKSGEVWVPTVLKGFTPTNCGVYVAQLVAAGVPRAKIKAVVSLTRSTKFTKPEQELLESKMQVMLVDYFTMEEFNGNANKPLRVRKATLSTALSSIKTKKFPQFKVASYVECSDIDSMCSALSDFGGGFVRKVPVVAKAEPSVDTKDDNGKKSGVGKASKKDKKAPKPEKTKVSKKTKGKAKGKKKSKK